jgi:hypothetical protein
MNVNFMLKVTVIERIINAVSKKKDGSIFFANSFPQFDEEYVGKVLSDLCKQGLIARLASGIYLKPVKSKFGIVYPPVSTVVKAIAKRDNAQILPTGNAALHQLGLSTQIPMNTEYITNGSARVIAIGKRTVKLKRSAPRNFKYKGKVIPVLVQALKTIGQQNLTDSQIGIIRDLLRQHPEEKTWREDIQSAPAWIKKAIMNIKNKLQHEQMDQ